jgi:hypothetical protein
MVVGPGGGRRHQLLEFVASRSHNVLRKARFPSGSSLPFGVTFVLRTLSLSSLSDD